ncbi:MAG: hypothetical protein EPO68_07635 [Planctomycetota bacterium]|nr:MAG: hypothetical protein EPO68_07635 [Planctomycetota bacterium]
MNLSLLFAEYISVHPNGFFSLLNGGINALAAQPVNDKGQQPNFNGHLLVRIESRPEEGGKHALKLRLQDQQNALLVPEITVNFETPAQPALPVNLALAIPIPLKKGNYAFIAEVDGKKLAHWPLAIVEQQQKPAGPAATPTPNPWGNPAGFGSKLPQA